MSVWATVNLDPDTKDRFEVRIEDVEAHLAGVEMLEVHPDGAVVVDGSYGGATARTVRFTLEGWPMLVIAMPMGPAQALGASLQKTQVEIARTMPGALPPPPGS